MAYAFDPDALDPEFRLRKNFDDAWLADLDMIRQLSEQEKQEEEDRVLAARVAGVTLDAVPDERRKMAILSDDYDDDHHGQQRTSLPLTPNSNKTTTKTPTQPKREKCAICLEFVSKTDPHTPCGHAYCIGCLKQLFEASLQDETLMPPRCCQKEVPVDLARLTLKEIECFNAKRLEYSTIDRVYCSKPTCSAFIPPSFIVNSVGTCPKRGCGVQTCSICKAASHGNADCPKDEATAAVLATARTEGWSRCYRCRAMVELAQGCYHMTCRCRGEFCYLCSVPWKDCKCPQWNEELLYTEARARTARVRAVENPRANDTLNVAARVEQMANQLRTNYECHHTSRWVYTPGGGRCEECHNYLPQYLFRCYQCHFMACNRCRRNRL